jgi:hypothetical protein
MTQQRKPPAQFLDWLEKTYGWWAARSWRLNNQVRAIDFLSDPYYQQWLQVTTAPGSSTKSDTENIKGRLSSVVGLKALEAIVDQLDAAGYIKDDEQYASLYLKYAPIAVENEKKSKEAFDRNYLERIGLPPDVREYIKGFTDYDDLADRLRNVEGLDDNARADIYDNWLKTDRDSDMAIRETNASYLEGQSKEQKGNIPEIARKNQYLTSLQPYWNYLTPEEQGLIQQYSTTELSQMNYDFGDIAKQRAKVAMSQGEQRSQGALSAFGGAAGQKSSGGTLNISDDVFRQFRSGAGATTLPAEVTKYAPGTRLRSFLESESAPQPGISQQSENWWNKVSQPNLGRLSRTEREAQAENLLGLSQTLSKETTLGNTYWGEGGPAAVAMSAYEALTKELANEAGSGTSYAEPGEGMGEGETERMGRGSGAKHTKKPYQPRDLIAEYYQRPGTGISSRLVPAIRFR